MDDELKPGTLVSVTMTRFASKWMEAAQQLAADPLSARRCPQCVEGTLVVADSQSRRDPALIERVIACADCDVEVCIELRPNAP